MKLQKKFHKGIVPFRFRMFAQFFHNHRRDVWDAMGCDYGRDIKPVNFPVHEANLETDVDIFEDGDIDKPIVTAFEIRYGVKVEQASALLRMCPRSVHNSIVTSFDAILGDV
jgi:hypothetical protein